MPIGVVTKKDIIRAISDNPGGRLDWDGRLWTIRSIGGTIMLQWEEFSGIDYPWDLIKALGFCCGLRVNA